MAGNLIDHSFENEDDAGNHPDMNNLSEEDTGVTDFAQCPPDSSESLENLFSRFRSHFDGNVYPFYAYDRNSALGLAMNAVTCDKCSFICPKTSYACNGGSEGIKKISGCIPVPAGAEFGKLNPEIIAESTGLLKKTERERCKVVLLAQPTEFGLVYTPEEIKEICSFAHDNDMLVQMDGSRLFFATARLLKAFREQTLFAGVDIATFGGSKNGASGGEVVLIFNDEIAGRYRKIQDGLKTDFSRAYSYSMKIDRLLTNRLWRVNASHANKMAEILGNELSEISGIRPVCRVETNKVLAEVSVDVLQKMREKYSFKTFKCPKTTIRLTTNFRTSYEDIKRLVDTIR